MGTETAPFPSLRSPNHRKPVRRPERPEMGCVRRDRSRLGTAALFTPSPAADIGAWLEPWIDPGLPCKPAGRHAIVCTA
jgi:hypothetical protein